MPDWQDAGLASSDNDDQHLDNELLKRAIDGDVDAYGQLYEIHAQAIFRFIYSHVSNRLDAEDLTEEVFMRVWRSLPGFKDRGAPFVAYLFRVARNAVIDFYRRNKYDAQETSLEDITVKDRQPEPGEATLHKMEHEEVREVMTQLRDEYRTVLVLRFLSNLSPDETAEVMGKTPGAVRVLQHRALAALRKLLGN